LNELKAKTPQKLSGAKLKKSGKR